MNYVKIYESLIQKGLQRITGNDVYYEGHHIIPRCMGGVDDPSNIVYLTPEEHYIAHMLLVKIHPKHYKLIYAANMMSNRNNKSYGWIKRKFAEQNSKDHKGFKHSEQSKKLMSEKRKNVKKSEKHKKAIGIKKLKIIEYKGLLYNGYDELKEKTKISYHLYNKFYKKGIDPEPYIGNNTYGIITKSKKDRPKHVKGKRWYNNGFEEKYFVEPPEGWKKGRLKRARFDNEVDF